MAFCLRDLLRLRRIRVHNQTLYKHIIIINRCLI